MRRMIAYFTILVSTFMLIGATAMQVFGALQTNLEFTNGREYVYRLSDKEDEENSLEAGAALAMASIMRARLESANVTRYNIVTEGNNQVRVTLSEVNETRYNRIQNLLAFDGEFSICTTRDTCYVGDEMFLDSVARVEYVGQTPSIVIPLSNATQFKDIIIKEAEEIASQEGAEGNTPQIILWANRTEADTFEASKTDNQVEDKIVLRFAHTNIWWDNEESGEIKTDVSLSKYGTQDETGLFPLNVVAQANEEANYLVNLFNASPLDYTVDFLFYRSINAAIEPLLVFDRFVTLNLSQTFIAITVGFVLLAVLLFFVYRLVGLSIWFNAVLTLFLTYVAYVQIGIQFSSATLFAGLAVLLFTFLGAWPFIQTLRQEIYRGRNVKKAFLEANGVSLMPQIEIAVVGIIIALAVFLVGGNLLQNFAVFTMLGSVIALLVTLVGLRLVLGLLLHEPSLNQRLDWIGINSKRIPNLAKDQKQTYFGLFSNTDFSAKKIWVTLGSLLLAGTFVVASVTFTVLEQPLFTPVATTIQSRLYIEVADGAGFDTLAEVENDLLPHITVDDQPFEFTDITFYEYARIEDEISVDYRMYVVESLTPYSIDTLVSFDDGANVITNLEFQDLLVELEFIFDNGDALITMSIHDVTPTAAQPNINEIMLAVVLSIVFGLIYYAIRLGLSRALVLTFNALLASIITGFFFSVLRTSTPSIVSFSAVLIPFAVMLIGGYLFQEANRQLRLQKLDTITLANETVQIQQTIARSASFLFVTALSLCFIALAFLAFGPQGLLTLYGATLLGLLLVLLLLTSNLNVLVRPLLAFTQPWIARLFAVRLTKNAKVKGSATSYSATEPVEATYIGIND